MNESLFRDFMHLWNHQRAKRKPHQARLSRQSSRAKKPIHRGANLTLSNHVRSHEFVGRVFTHSDSEGTAMYVLDCALSSALKESRLVTASNILLSPIHMSGRMTWLRLRLVLTSDRDITRRLLNAKRLPMRSASDPHDSRVRRLQSEKEKATRVGQPSQSVRDEDG